MISLLEDRLLLKKNGDVLEEISNIEEKLKGIDIIAYYFGGKWCSDCEIFTPILRDFYNVLKERNESFEIIYVSSDKSEEEMREFVLDCHGDWYVLYVDESNEDADDFEFIWYIRGCYYVEGIPKLIITKNNDSVLVSSKGVTDLLSKAENAFDEWMAKTEDDDNEEEEVPLEHVNVKPNCCKISKFKPWVKTPPVEMLAGMNLLRKVESEFKEEPAEEVLGNVEIIAFYFSASWCGPCHRFTPDLKKCYEELKAENKPFEVIFVSDDESEEEMKNYMQDLHGNWCAVPYDNENFKRSLKRKFQVDGIPTLGIVNKNGEWIVADGCDDVSIKGAKAFDNWLIGKSGISGEDMMNMFFKKMEVNEGGEEEAPANEETS